MKNTSLIFFQRLDKHPPFFSKSYPIHNPERRHLKPLPGYVYKISLNKVQKYNLNQNEQRLYMPDLKFKPINKIFKVTIPSVKYTKNSKFRQNFLTGIQQFTIQSHVTLRKFKRLRKKFNNFVNRRKSI